MMLPRKLMTIAQIARERSRGRQTMERQRGRKGAPALRPALPIQSGFPNKEASDA
jgi:hypothetical protein